MRGFFSPTQFSSRRHTGTVAKCGACGLYKTCSSPKMPVYGHGRAGVLVVGEAPGATEDRKGRPFVGDAGETLRRMLKSIGVSLDKDAWTTNAVICRPPDNQKPDAKKIDHCLPNLHNTIRELQPNVVIPLGKVPLDAILRGKWLGKVDEVSRWVGWQIPHEDYWICPTYHPSFVMRSHDDLLERLVTEHLEEAFAIHTRPPKQPNWKELIRVELDPEKASAELDRMARRGRPFATDYETNSLKADWKEAKLFSCAVCDGKRTISFPWSPGVRDAAYRLFRSKTPKIAANAKFEERWTRKEFGVGMRNWLWDTMLASHALDNRTGITSVKFQAFVRLGVPTYNDGVLPYLVSARGHFNRIQEAPLRDLLFYGGMDAILEYRLAMLQMKEMGVRV